MDSPATTAAVAAVIDAHTPTGYEGNVTCWCGPNFDSWVEHSEHVAALILAALNLAEEWTWSWDRDAGRGKEPRPGYGFSVPTREEAVAESDSHMTIVARLVGPWQEQP